LTNDYFVKLLGMGTKWSRSSTADGIYDGRDRKSGALKWTATPVDLMFGSNDEPRSLRLAPSFGRRPVGAGDLLAVGNLNRLCISQRV
jgi:catalase (peroxidase I)